MPSETEPDFNATWRFRNQSPSGADGSARLAVLIVLRGAQVGRRYLLNEDCLVLGRSAERADLIVPGDPKISGGHCRIARTGPDDGWSLFDLSSTNGTIVGDRQVASAVLADGDRIQIGGTILKFCFHDAIEDDFHRQVDHLMNIDDLTGLPVQRVFRQRFQDALRDRAGTARPMAVFMMDLDGLKRINDQNGHHVGAASIAEIGRRLGALVGALGGVVSRFGGDEFSAFVPDLDRAATTELGERLRAAVGGEPVRVGEIAVQPTISIGAANCPDDGESAEGLMRRADAALYRAKAEGRDRVSR
jgi:diguanylate cyclase (GGDEF)-like protein